MNKTFFAIIFSFFFSGAILANNNTIVKHYSRDNGLTHNTVKCAIKDKDGFMWFGTWYGLSSFDGVKFKDYNIRNEFSMDIPPRKIQKIIEGKNGNLWIKTTDHKLFLFDKKSECFRAVYNEIKKKYPVSTQIIKIQQTDDDALLMLTQNKDLLRAEIKDDGELKINLLYNSQEDSRTRNVRRNVLFEDEDYLSWIGKNYTILSCRKGVDLKKKPSDFLVKKITSKKDAEFSCAHFSNNELWLGDESGNVYRLKLNNGNAEKLNIPGVKGEIENIISLNKELIYITVKNQAIYEYDVKRMIFTKVAALNPGESVTNSVADSYDKIWFELNSCSLLYFDTFEKSSRRFTFAQGKTNESVIMQDGQEKGMFFLTTKGEPVMFDRASGEISYVNENPALTQVSARPQQFYDMLFDKDGILWLSSVGDGVYSLSFSPRQFKQITPPGYEGRASSSVKSIFSTKNGDIWMGLRSADVLLLDKNLQLKRIFDQKNSPIGAVYHIMEDRKGNVWFSTKGSGLVKAVPDAASASGYRFSRYRYSEKDAYSLSGNDVYYTYQDSKGRIWVAMFGGGLCLVDDSQSETRFYHKFNTFKNYPQYGLYMETRNIIEDNQGRIWVGTTDGLVSFDGNFEEPSDIEFEVYRSENVGSNVSDNDIYVLYKDSSSQIWMSVFGGGLCRLEGYDSLAHKPIISSYALKEGLSSDVILSMQEDENRNLWLATESGLSRFSIDNESFRNFDIYDGFPSLKMEEDCAIRTDSGLLFGHKNGLLAFSPESLSTINSDYATFLVDMKISNKDFSMLGNKESVKYARSITLDYEQSMFAIEFAALNFYNQNRISYNYILEGYEKEWHANGMNRYASYTNVPSGDYVFRVRTVDEANPELKSEATIEIRILPPWWRTVYAYIVYIILAVLLIYGVVRLVLFLIRMKNDVYIAQKLSELKIRFFTNISHELRTPLTLIKGPIQELREKENLSPKGLQYVNLMEKNTEHMLQLVNQILDFRKIQNGKMRLHVSQIDINRLVESLQKEFAVLAEENEISYNIQMADEDIHAWADKDKIETVLRNILSNAFKFTPAGGSIIVSVGLSKDSTMCYIRIEDTGVGIPQNKLSDIFDRFSQADNAKNTYYQGTGIGLALSKEIINLHHGTISVESTPEKGSSFTIQLHIDKEHYAEGEVDFYVSDEVALEKTSSSEPDSIEEEDEQEEQNIDNSLPVLLLVEDNKDLCDLIRLQMEDRFNIYVASNGAEGLKKIHVCHPDIVVTDLMMPEMDGMQMLKMIRSDFQISHIPVIILTAKYGEEAKTKAISMGANAYITKPFSRDYLEARIDQLLNERKLFRENIWQHDQVKADEQKVDDYGQYLVKKDVEFLDKIHNVIEENMMNSDFNMDTIATTIGLSRSAFFKKLKGLTGLAPVELAKDIRLNKSIELIKTTDMTISEIAFAVGFKDSGYYSKCFRKKYNQTPREYISECRKTSSN